MREAGFLGSKIKIGKPTVAGDEARLGAVRAALGPDYEIMTDANQRFTIDEAIRRARCLTPLDIAWFEEPARHVGLFTGMADRGYREAITYSFVHPDDQRLMFPDIEALTAVGVWRT